MRQYFKISFCLLLLVLSSCNEAKTGSAAPDPDLALRVCSQNLHRFGEKKTKRNSKHQRQKNFLVARILRAKCSVVALQEVYLDRYGRADEALKELVKALEIRSYRKFSYYAAKSADKYITNGFLVADDIGEVKKTKSYWNKGLPRMQPFSPARSFSRGPFSVLIELKPEVRKSGRIPKNLLVFTMHFKSRYDGWKDPAKMNFEVARMEMAEGLRTIALDEADRLGEDAALIILGDRNNFAGSASSEVLSGELKLEDFSDGTNCSVSKQMIAQCKREPQHPQQLVGLFGLRKEKFPKRYKGGSHKYRGKEHLLDEIFIRPKDLELVSRKNGYYAVGFEGQFFKGSDHKLLWLELAPG